MSHIKKDDNIIVISGKDKGKRGKILKVYPAINKVIAEGINLVKKNKKKNPPKEQGGIISQEAPLYISKVMLFCGKCNKGVRIRRQLSEDNVSIRYCKKCGEPV